MDRAEVGRRIAQFRGGADMTQEGLARSAGMSAAAVEDLESGRGALSVGDLASVAEALSVPLAALVDDPVPAVVSRRTDPSLAHETTRPLDLALHHLAADVRTLTTMGLLTPVGEPRSGHVPRTHPAAEKLADRHRTMLGLGSGPIDDLGRVAERLGLHVHAAGLGAAGPDGGCVEVTVPAGAMGAALVNADAQPGRGRTTLAHEIGHWIMGDAYDTAATPAAEKMINSFAFYFLAPRAGVTKVWASPGWATDRDRCVAVAAQFKLSWTAAVAHARNLDLISGDAVSGLQSADPGTVDYVRLGLRWSTELESPYLSPAFAAGCLRGYITGRLTRARTLEMLRGTVSGDDLPAAAKPTLADLRPSFMGHGD